MPASRLLPLPVLLLFHWTAFGQKPYFQQQVDHQIEVQLDDSTHRLRAQSTITYSNHSSDTLRFIWFHLWPNAYKSERTAFGQQQIENGDTRFYFSSPTERGYINQLDFRVNGSTAQTVDHPEHMDIVKLILPDPLPPQATIQITTPFSVQLPSVFSRSGHGKNNVYQITQWYPKPAVYDRDGWHPIPYLDQGEFYSEFGNYTVRLSVPEEYAVAATGVLIDSAERMKLIARTLSSNHGVAQRTYDQNGQRAYKTLQYRADSVHDFAWFASPNYRLQYDTCRLTDGSSKEIWHFYLPTSQQAWDRSIEYSKNALRYYSDRVGSYPYPSLTVVEAAEGPGGGMEYPMLSVIDPVSDIQDLKTILLHEVGHNWFYGALGSNERTYPWMDEGLNSYYERSFFNKLSDPTEDMLLQSLYYEKKDQPIQTPSEAFSPMNYAAIAYLKAAQWVKGLERAMGPSQFDLAMKDYYHEWKFKHPSPADLFHHLQAKSTGDLSSYFSLVDKKGPLAPAPKRGWTLRTINRWSDPNDIQIKNRITALPLIGYNQYDGLMTGIGLTNLKLPLNDLQWMVLPLYATRSKQINGLGFINHRWRPAGIWGRIDLGLAFSTFTFNRFTAPNGQTLTLRFTKWAPGLRLTWKEEPRSTRHRQLQFTYFQFTETGYRFQRDTLISGTDTTFKNYYRTQRDHRGLGQVKFTVENNRTLYPYRWEAKLEGNADFLRPSLTASQFFNYPKGGGLHVRIFGGAFAYLGNPGTQARFRQARYYLQMSGPTGNEDYTYSTYFLGRSAFDGFNSQQIMERDGAFKLRTDKLASPVGRSDNWLLALNLSSSIPASINPLSVLPIRIPLHVFLDIGATGNTTEEVSRWQYVAGLELPLLQRNIRFFLPLLYSKPFRNYVRTVLEPEKRFWQKISFQLNLSQWNPRQLRPEIDLW